MPVSDYQPLFERAGKQYNVDPQLLASVATVESGGDPKAASQAGAQGLMQLMPATAKALGVADPFDPTQAIPAAAKLLAQNLDRYKNPADALMAYNAGTDQAKWNNPETQGYVPKIVAAFKGALMPSAQAAEAKPGDAVMPGNQTPAASGQSGDAASSVFGPLSQSAPPDDGVSTVTVTAKAPPAGQGLDATMARLRAGQASTAPAEPSDAASMVFGPLQSTSPVAAPATAPAVAPAAAPPASGSGFLGAVNAGLNRFGHDVTDVPAELLARGGTALANRLGISLPAPTGEQLAASDAAARGAFDRRYGGNLLAQGTRLAGDAASVALPVGAIGRTASAAGDTMLGTNALARVLASAGSGAAQGAAGSALTAGASDQPIGAQMRQGAEWGGAFGAGAPVAERGLQYLGTAGRAATNFFLPTEGATNRLAQSVLDRFAGSPLALNTAEIVPGSQPTLAEAAGNPGVTRLQNALAESEPATGNRLYERLRANAAARGAAVQGATGTEADLQSAVAQRSAITPEAAFSGKQPTDAQPVVDEIKSILGGTGGGRTAVQSALGKLQSTLTDADGNLLPAASDPEYLYDSARKQIADLLDKSNLEDASGRQAARELLQVRDVLDGVIEKGAPGFGQFRAEYAAASRPIDAMKWLQGLSLTDAQGNVTLQKVQNALRNYGKQTSVAANGVKGAASVTPEQRAALEAVRDDLLRGQNLNLSTARGSNTVQNLATQSLIDAALPGPTKVLARVDPRFLGAAIGLGTGHGVLDAGIGGMFGQVARSFGASRNEAIRNRLVEMMLNPSLHQAPISSTPGVVGNALTKFQPYVVPTATLGATRLPAPHDIGGR